MSKYQIFVLLGIAAPGLVAVIGFVLKKKYGLAAALAVLFVFGVYLSIQ